MDLDPGTIVHIAYDSLRAKLVIGFERGERLVYVGVPGHVHRSLLDAESRAGFFHSEIAERYPYNRLEA